MLRIKRLVVAFTPPILIKAGKMVLGMAPTESNPLMSSFVSADLGAYSQFGEDLVIDAALEFPDTGFYVDIGANDPVKLNNTKRFHKRGWHGINVEPNPSLCSLIQEDRPADANLNVGVGAADGTLDFYRMDPDTHSSFDRTIVDEYVLMPGVTVVEATKVKVTTLASIFRKHVPEDQVIDFMSLDIEGGELAALGGNDWETWRPRLIMLEINLRGDKLVDFMESVDYDYVWSNGCNGLFRDRRSQRIA